jgi:hypothetical protein
MYRCCEDGPSSWMIVSSALRASNGLFSRVNQSKELVEILYQGM